MLSRAILAAALVAAASAAASPLRIDGLVAAVFSPFDKDSNLDLSVVPAQHAYLNATGVNWVFVGGTTGESLKLTKDERKDLNVAWIKAGSNVIAHCGAESMVDARELAVHAVSNGAKAIGAMPPVFFKPANVQALALTIASICNTVPDVPCYYYHIPSMTGVALVMYDFMVAIEPLAANFAGIKYTGLYTYPGFMDVQKCMNYKDGKYEVLSGREDMMLEALSLGVKGHVGSQFNFAGDLFNGIREQYAADGITTASQTEIRGRQFNAVELIHSWLDASPTGMNGAKYFMNLAGVPVGEARLPNIPVDASAGKALDAAHAQFCAAGENRKLRMCQHKAAIAGN